MGLTVKILWKIYKTPLILLHVARLKTWLTGVRPRVDLSWKALLYKVWQNIIIPLSALWESFKVYCSTCWCSPSGGYLKNHCTNARLVCTWLNAIFVIKSDLVMKIWFTWHLIWEGLKIKVSFSKSWKHFILARSEYKHYLHLNVEYRIRTGLLWYRTVLVLKLQFY